MSVQVFMPQTVKPGRQTGWNAEPGLSGKLAPLSSCSFVQMGLIQSFVVSLLACSDICGREPDTQVIAPRRWWYRPYENMVESYPKIQYILDHRHLESHFYGTADSLARIFHKERQVPHNHLI